MLKGIYRQVWRPASTNSPYRARERRDALKYQELHLPLSSLHEGVCRMNPETQQSESPYCVRIETDTGQSATVPIAVLTPKQLEVFLQSEFKRLAQEAGVKGVRIHVERAVAADYEQVLREVTACLSSAKTRVA